MAMMSNEGEKKCPLCAEDMDWTDQQLKPCKCGYEVCVWCWHHIMDMAEKDETEGRCPACRTPYDKEKIVGTEAKCERIVAKKDREIKPQKTKPKKQDEKKDLSNVRVIQRRMAYVIGLPLSLADEDILQRKNYFGQYGKITKVALSRTAGGAIQHFVNDSCSVYITYSKEEEAVRCIQSVHGFVLEGRSLRASFGTAKYCHAWLKKIICNNSACLYLHKIGADEDSFGKDEEAAVHTRNRVHQIVGATQNMQRRSGSMLPPPLNVPLDSSGSITSDESISHCVKNEMTCSGSLNCITSSKDQDERMKIPNRSFSDVVARTSSGPELENVTEDRNPSSVCSDSSSLLIDESYQEMQNSNDLTHKVSSICQLPKAVVDNESSYFTANSLGEPVCFHLPLPVKESQCFAVNSFTDPSKNSVSGGADCTKEQSSLMSDSSQGNHEEALLPLGNQVSVLASTYPDRHSDSSNSVAQQCLETSGLRGVSADVRNVNYANQVSAPFKVVNSSSVNGFTETKICTHPDLDGKGRSHSISDEEIVEQLRKLDDHNPTTNIDSFALDAVESNIVSSILSLDFDSCDDSLGLPHRVADLYGGSDRRQGGSLWSSSKSDSSRFLFAKENGYGKESSDFSSSLGYIDQASKSFSLFSDYAGKDSVEKPSLHSGPQNNGLRTQTSAPPGFSFTHRDPPPGFASCERTNPLHPGFASCERTNSLHPASTGSYSVNPTSYPNSHYCAMMNGHTRMASDFDISDPAILVVHGGKSTKEVTNPGIDFWQTTSTPQFTAYNDDKARLWLMQQAGATHQGTQLAPAFVQDQSFVHQGPTYSISNGDGFTYVGNSFGVNSKITTDQKQTYNPLPYSQFSQQNYGIGHVSDGYWSSHGIRQKGDFSIQEVQKSDRLGFDNYYSGHRDLMYQMPSTGDVYNSRVYGI